MRKREVRPKITLQKVRQRVEAISKLAEDDETAHSCEDNLWEEVLEAIGNGVDDAPALARAALRTTKIKFSRWCA